MNLPPITFGRSLTREEPPGANEQNRYPKSDKEADQPFDEWWHAVLPPLHLRSHPFEVTAQTDQKDSDANGNEKIPHRSQERSDVSLRHVISPPSSELIRDFPSNCKTITQSLLRVNRRPLSQT